MRTDLECLILERTTGIWFYFLENQNAPQDAFDWLDYATAYGPFTNKESAFRDLQDNYPDFSGSSIIDATHYDKLSGSQREKYEDLLKHIPFRSV